MKTIALSIFATVVTTCCVTVSVHPAAAATNAASCGAQGAAVTQKAICADAASRASDATMRTAYEALLKQSTPADQKVFADSQSAWLDDRDTDCDTVDDTDTPAKPAEIAACATKESDARYKYLAGHPNEGPGASDAIIPVMREGQGFIWSLRFAEAKTPAEKLINDKLDAQLADIHIGKPDDSNDYTDNFYAELSYASPDFVSIAVDGSKIVPGSDAKQFDYNLNVDMKTGKLLTFDDAFGADAASKLQGLCEKQLGEFLALPSYDGSDTGPKPKTVLDAKLADLSQWAFGASEASIVMDPGDEDAYTCKLAYADLKPMLKAGFPLPQ